MIIPYSSDALTWHLSANTFGMQPSTIERIVNTCEAVNRGEKSLEDELTPDAGITVAEMLDDLQIDYNN